MTPDWWKSASTAVSLAARAAVWLPAARDPAAVRPAFRATIGFCRRDAPGDAGEPARVSERFEVQEDDAGLRVFFPVLEEIVARHVRLVADADERGEAHLALGGQAQNRDAERAALRRERHVPPGRKDRRERRVQSYVRHSC